MSEEFKYCPRCGDTDFVQSLRDKQNYFCNECSANLKLYISNGLDSSLLRDLGNFIESFLVDHIHKLEEYDGDPLVVQELENIRSKLEEIITKNTET